MNRFLRIVPDYQATMAVTVTILYLTLFPQPLGNEEFPMFPGADKVVHAIMFGTLAGALIFDRWHEGRPFSWKGATLCALVATAFGGLIELLQQWMNLGRGCDIYDFLADAAGALLAVPITFKWHKGAVKSKG